MSNPIFDMMNHSTYDLSQYKSLYRAFTKSSNPTQVLYQLAGNNPQLQPIIQFLNSGGNPEQMARTIMAQRGINPDDFLRALGGLKDNDIK